MNKLSLAIFLFLPLLFFSCKTTKEAGEGRLKKMPADSLLAELKEQAVDFEWFSGKAKISYKDDKRSQNFTANIRMKKDSVIYASLTSLMGVEAARIMITPDSISIIDRLNKIYYREPFDYVQNYFPIPVDISLLQNIIIGNPFLIEPEKIQSRTDKGFYSLICENQNMVCTLKIFPENYSLSTEHLLDKQLNRALTLIFTDYKTADNTEFSFQREVSFKGEQKVNMEVKFSHVKLNEPQSFPFFISDKYENRF